MKNVPLLGTAVPLGLLAWFAGCESPTSSAEQVTQSVGSPSTTQVPLDPATIPKFAHELTIPPVYAPTVITDASGRVIRHEYTVSIAPATVQLLPPGFPATNVMAYGAQVQVPGSDTTVFARTMPGPTFEATRGIPQIVRWRNQITTPSFMPVDPTLHWSNPQAIEP